MGKCCTCNLNRSLFWNSQKETWKYVGAAMLITALYSSLSGLWGVAITDIVQFVLAMTGSIVLAVLVVQSDKIGGISGLTRKITCLCIKLFSTNWNGRTSWHHINNYFCLFLCLHEHMVYELVSGCRTGWWRLCCPTDDECSK